MLVSELLLKDLEHEGRFENSGDGRIATVLPGSKLVRMPFLAE